MTNNQPTPPSNRAAHNSEPRTLESVQEELRNLQEENFRLREQLNNLDTIEELLVHRVAEKSQNKILALAVAIATVLSVIGIFGINNLISSDQIKKQVVDGAVNQMRKEKDLINEIAKKVSDNLAEERALISSKDYFVVAGTSPKKSDLESELGRVKKLRINDSLFDDKGRYSETKICPPKEGNRFFALVIAKNKTLPDASEIVEQAKKDGFRQDTYPLPSNKAFFDCSG